ncbi:MFS general substrate transporter [Thozetella sp. PMI_491]|nr:MFS general substrate transporter [Thozetella sp. PMI_491]
MATSGHNPRDEGKAIDAPPVDQQAPAREEPQEATWDGEDDPENPYNWSMWRKVSIGMLYSTGQLVTIMTAGMIAPALEQIAADLGMTDSAAQLSFSVFFLGLGFAPFVLAALSEVFGRKPVWIVCNIWYIVWNALCPVGNSQAMLIIGRLMSASGASAGVTLTGPAMGDMFEAKDRGKSQAIAALLPYLGPALGPIIGGIVSQYVRWQWLFWILSLADTVILFIGLVVLRESYPPVLLERKAKRAAGQSTAVPSLDKERRRQFMQRLKTSLARPVRILLRRPIIQVLTLILGLDFGTYTLVLSSYATLYIDKYDQSESTSSLHYISIAVGSTIAAQVGGRFMDWLWASMKKRHPERDPVPEYRIPHMVLPAIVFPMAMFWYGWSAEYGVSWPAVDIGVAVFTIGNFMISQAPNAYILDEFGNYAASAMAAVRMFTYVLGFTFPLFAPQLYETLGYGWGNSLLAFLFYLFGLPIIAMVWFYGPKLRAIGRE